VLATLIFGLRSPKAAVRDPQKSQTYRRDRLFRVLVEKENSTLARSNRTCLARRFPRTDHCRAGVLRWQIAGHQLCAPTTCAASGKPIRPHPQASQLDALATKPGEKGLLSFALITEDPPPEIAATEHNRLLISVKPENIDVSPNPDPRDLDAVDAILEDKLRPYYAHRISTWACWTPRFRQPRSVGKATSGACF